MSAILWAFEAREIIAEFFETSFGTRLHVNIFYASIFSSEMPLDFLAVGDLFAFLASGLRLCASRMWALFSVGFFARVSALVTAIFAEVSGQVERENYFEVLTTPVVGKIFACCLVRHFCRAKGSQLLGSMRTSDGTAT